MFSATTRAVLPRYGRLLASGVSSTSASQLRSRAVKHAGTFSRGMIAKNFSSTPETPKGSEGSESAGEKQSSELRRMDFDEYDDYDEPPKTAGEAVARYAYTGFWLSLMAGGLYCIYVLAKEIFPGRMNPNSLFSEVFDKLKFDDRILEMTGSNVKAFGRDSGRRTEGRRNQIDSRKFVDDRLGTSCLRVRFNMEGTRGKVKVWASVLDSTPANEYVYIIVQNMRTGQVLTIEDNRDMLLEEAETKKAENANSMTSQLSAMFGGAEKK